MGLSVQSQDESYRRVAELRTESRFRSESMKRFEEEKKRVWWEVFFCVLTPTTGRSQSPPPAVIGWGATCLKRLKYFEVPTR